MGRTVGALTLAIGLVLARTRPAGALPSGSPVAAESIALCRQAEHLDGEAGGELLARGLTHAEAALATNDADALAHFALFCNLGRRVQTTGLRFARPLEILRALRALDSALHLAPDDPDVAAAKGALLVSLPWLLGGDVRSGEAWLRRALDVDPDHCAARWYLAELLARRGVGDEAVRLQGPCRERDPGLRLGSR